MKTAERVSLWVLVLALLAGSFINIKTWEVQREINDLTRRALLSETGA